MFYLENWIHQIAASVLKTARVTRSELDRYQLLRLRQTIQYAYEKSSFYRGLFGSAGIAPEDVRRLSDLPRLPLTEPRQLSESPYRFLCVSQSEVARPYSFVTSGTTGPQKKIFWSQADLERIIEFMAAGIGTVAGPEDVVQVMLANGRPYSQADLLSRGVKKLGAIPVPADMNLSSGETLKTIENNKTTVLFGYTNLLFRVSKELGQKRDLSSVGLKTLFLAGEYLPDAMRREFQRLWHCSIRTHYGLTEMGLGVAVECEAGDGYHFNEAGLLLEIIDPHTGKSAPPGEEGELVFTTLTREAMPLIRYRTHDISALIPGPCPCGAASLLKIGTIKKRLESIITLEGGDQIYPSLFDDVLFEVPEIIDYQVALGQDGGKHRLDFRVEALTESPDILPRIGQKLLSIPILRSRIAEGRMVEPAVTLVPSGTLQSSGRRKKLICL